MKRLFLVLAALILFQSAAEAARSGGSFGGRGGFRSAPRGSYSRPAPSGYGSRGPNIIFFPGFGWGGGYGMGGGGFTTMLILGVLGVGLVMAFRSQIRNHALGRSRNDSDEAPVWDRAFVYKVQLGLGRSARQIQERLARFAAEGDTSTEAGLTQLLQQTSLELLREKDAIRYAAIEQSGPMSMQNGETKLNGASLAERSRFQIERVRGTDGKVHKSDVVAKESSEALEYVVVTLVLATREPLRDLPSITEMTERDQMDAVLGQLGGVPHDSLLGLEVIWTPADAEDSLTQMDLMTAYPQMRSL